MFGQHDLIDSPKTFFVNYRVMVFNPTTPFGTLSSPISNCPPPPPMSTSAPTHFDLFVDAIHPNYSYFVIIHKYKKYQRMIYDIPIENSWEGTEIK